MLSGRCAFREVRVVRHLLSVWRARDLADGLAWSPSLEPTSERSIAPYDQWDERLMPRFRTDPPSRVRRSTLCCDVRVGVLAQQSANFDSCLALSEQRGAGIESGHRNHTGFMRDCLAGRVPFTTGGPALAPAPQAYAESYDRCATLSEQRGTGTTSGGRTHREFMTECMAGRIR